MSKETRTTSTALRNSDNRKHNTDQKRAGVAIQANETAEKRTIDSRQQNNTSERNKRSNKFLYLT